MKIDFRLMILGVATLALAACEANKPASAAKQADVPADAPTVAVVHPSHEDLARSVNLTAEFRPYQEVDVHAKVAGFVKVINVDVGDHVKTGDVLAVLEIPELDEDLKKADAAVATSQQDEESAQAAFDETNDINRRLLGASKEAPGLIAQQDLDTAAAKNRAGAANVAAAKQKVIEAQANAARERAMADYAKITAPFDGVVTKRYADTGSLIQAGTSSSTQSEPVVRLAELHRLRLDLPVPESCASNVHVGDSVEVDVVSLGLAFTAKVSRFAQSVDDATRTMLTEIDVENPDFHITPGMYATARMTLASRKDALAVPIQCVSSGDNPTVLVLGADHRVEECPVTLGLETASMAQITSGLKADDLVVIGSRSTVPLGQVALAKEVTESKL